MNLTAITTFHLFNFFAGFTLPFQTKMSNPPPPTLSNLHVSLSAPAPPTSPPSFTVSLTNTSPNPLTILTWASPLDPLLIQLGLVTITPSGAPSPLDIPVVMLKRRMPPSPDALVTLEPGETVTRKVEIGERFVGEEELRGDGKGRLRVQVQGEWQAVWVGKRKEDVVGSESLDALGRGGEEGEVLRGAFGSEVLEMEV
jgi:hypothetical protein